jgi:hypothetical protein
MRTVRPSWAILLLIGAVRALHPRTSSNILTCTQGAAEAGLDLTNAPRFAEKRFDHAVDALEGAQGNNVEGVAGPAIEARNPLDASALLNGLGQGPEGNTSGNNKPSTGNIGGDLANQIAGGGSPSLDQIVGGVNGQGKGGAQNQSTSQEPGKPKGEGNVGGQVASQNSAGNGIVIQIERTTIMEANGQQIQTDVVKEVGKQSPAPALVEAPPAASPAAPPAAAQPTPPPAPKGEMSASLPAPMAALPSPEGKPAPPPPAAMGEMPQPGPEGKPAPSPGLGPEGMPAPPAPMAALPPPEGKPAPPPPAAMGEMPQPGPEGKPGPPPAPMAGMPPPPAEGKPGMLPPPAPPAPAVEVPKQAANSTAVMEAAKSAPEARITTVRSIYQT